VIPGIPTVPATRIRYGVQAIGADFLPASPVASETPIRVIEEPWRSDATPPRPDGETTETTRLITSPIEVRGVGSQGTSSATRPDRIVTASGTWEPVEVVDAPAMPGIPRHWAAYCRRVEPGDTP
jgi:hypothetical protein